MRIVSPRDRLLNTMSLLSLETSLRPRRGPNTWYELVAKEGDATVYVPIPLSCLKGVELVSYSVAASLAEIDGTPGCCGGAFACFRVSRYNIASEVVSSVVNL